MELSRLPPLSVAPGIALAYRIETQDEHGKWHSQINITGNIQQHRCHSFAQPVTTKGLRVVIDDRGETVVAGLTTLRAYTHTGSYPDPWQVDQAARPRIKSSL